jgi:hypothetical protein
MKLNANVPTYTNSTIGDKRLLCIVSADAKLFLV